MEEALKKLTEILRIVSEDAKLYYLKEPDKIDEKILKDVSLSFISISQLSREFADLWFASRLSGEDAIQRSDKLEERIDFKLFGSGKLDFEQMKKMMKRLHRIDDALYGLSRIGSDLKYYRDLCRVKKLDEYAALVDLFLASSLDVARDTLEAEGKKLQNQIERCNLYYQPVIKTRTLWVAVCSLAVSSLAFLITILKALNII